MPVIRVSDPTFQRLQAVAVPLVDTPSAVIDRLLDLYDDVKAAGEHLHGGAAPGRASSASPDRSSVKSPLAVDPDSPPDLTHTRIIQASIAGKSAEKWNDLVHTAHRVAVTVLGSTDKLQSISKSNILGGDHRRRGFHYLNDLNVSIQNVSANDAWRRILHLARKLKVPLQVEVEWERHKGAHLPGERRTLRWSPDLEA